MSDIYFYKIVCNDENIKEVYVGQTTNIERRTYKHMHFGTEGKERKLYKFIMLNGGWNNWKVETICKMYCVDKNEITKIERFFIKLYKASLNVQLRCPKIVEAEIKENNDSIFNSFIEVKIIKTEESKDKILRGDLYKEFHMMYPQIKKPFFLTKMETISKIYKIKGNYYYKFIKLVS